ncbi:MAG: bifunctional phosphoribosyl-AMP cyclohydrolase/phosphoribosyl-ATP diphosphatase HisIE [Gemmatimonadales bacterium]|nr:MAG: bifunctional phosphoribosyl-AMP cyclohydrolase/phosphoribosyl-ATP diphosphatase HisIE [Gemmatimonadales bacterium]
MTDRTLTSAADLDHLTWDGRGLVPVVAQDADGGQVLMVAWANREALEQTLSTGFMHYWSRSRERLWKKGETSGNTQEVVSLHADCDADTVLARVRMTGPACHTGEATCFGRIAEPPITGGAPGTHDHGSDTYGPAHPAPSVLPELWELLEARARERPEGSYTTRLLSDENLRLKKLGEETVEVVTALLRDDGTAPDEAADLIYHLLVALLAAGVSWDQVEARLQARRR